MEGRPILIASVCVNLALIGGLLYQTAILPRSDQLRHREPLVTNNVTELSVEVVRPPAPEIPKEFKWSDVESADYKVYINNLKSIDCPPATIRDLILAEVSDQYTRRRTTMLGAVQASYWDLLAVGKLESVLAKGLDQLNTEKEGLSDQLLALIGPTGEISPEPPVPATLNFLPPEKQRLMLQWEQGSRAARQHARQLRADAAGQDQLKADAQKLEASIKELLTPEEFEEYQLRHSPNANWAASLYGFEPTQAEYRAVTRIKDELAAASPGLSEKDPAFREAVAVQAAKVDEKLVALMGEARFAEYQRARDENYRVLCKVAERYRLSPEVAAQAYQVKRAADEQFAAILPPNPPGLPPGISDEQRAAAILLQEEVTKALQKTLGKEAFTTYIKYGGDWLKKMALQ